jgi:hypothetical protein
MTIGKNFQNKILALLDTYFVVVHRSVQHLGNSRSSMSHRSIELLPRLQFSVTFEIEDAHIECVVYEDM